MPITISFSDFDTVCYSNQHNIIELIKRAVGISVEINIQAGQISNLQQQVQNLDQTKQEAHDAWLLAQSLNERVSAVEFRTTEMWNNHLTFQSSPLGDRIQRLEERIDALGG